MEFVRKGGLPSCRFFYNRHVYNPGLGEDYEDFGFAQEAVVMTPEEYEKLAAAAGVRPARTTDRTTPTIRTGEEG